MEEIVVLITASSDGEAREIGSYLVEKRLVACANIIGDIQSIFRWQGKVETEREVLLVLKSAMPKLPEIIKETKRMHSYQVPEIIALPILGGSQDYLNWIHESTKDV
ncbi:divalent-cation tolerance protein CutA [candidate division KSB1 bacterium]|nr:divalent-cation tolerance protein CutA [candidate division KSB1 bacterium]